LLDALVAEQADVVAFGASDGGFGLGEHHFAAGAEAGLDLDPGLLENDLGGADQQADAHAENDQADGPRAVHGLAVNVLDDAGQHGDTVAHHFEEDAAQDAADDPA